VTTKLPGGLLYGGNIGTVLRVHCRPGLPPNVSVRLPRSPFFSDPYGSSTGTFPGELLSGSFLSLVASLRQGLSHAEPSTTGIDSCDAASPSFSVPETRLGLRRLRNCKPSRSISGARGLDTTRVALSSHLMFHGPHPAGSYYAAYTVGQATPQRFPHENRVKAPLGEGQYRASTDRMRTRLADHPIAHPNPVSCAPVVPHQAECCKTSHREAPVPKRSGRNKLCTRRCSTGTFDAHPNSASRTVDELNQRSVSVTAG
jgi:hypothetical protein